MTKEEIKEKINQYKWEKWLERDFGAFIMSLFAEYSDTKKIGMDIEILGFVFQKGFWYFSKEVYGKLGDDIEKWMAENNKDMFDISASCEKFYIKAKKRIKEIVKAGKADKETMRELGGIFGQSTNYIWLAHGLEEMYMKRFKIEVPKYWKGDESLFIGDISFPKKKNSHTIFEEKLKAAEDLKKLVEEYGWLKIRNGFDDPFTVEDLKEIKEKIKSEKEQPKKRVAVPKGIKDLVKEVRELVFYRTYRTNVFFELLFLARPIFKKYGESLGLEFKEMKNCRIDDLINGVVKKYPVVVTVAQYKSDYAFFDEDVVTEEKMDSREIKGSIAFMGKARGIAKIVGSVKDLPKVKDGDVLVTNMTTPNYLVAMKRAIAFVTDEGGITCHAAIVAREMKKPCIIGTKIATRVLKDGDLVEVDANNGVVKIINR